MPEASSAGSTLPEAVTVGDLVRRGRYPHQGFFQAPTRQDEAMVERALELAGVTDLRARAVDELVEVGVAHDLDAEAFVVDTASAAGVIGFVPWAIAAPGRAVAGI